MRRWLITGASGFIGARVARLLAAAGDEVLGIGRKDANLLDVPAAVSVLQRAEPTHLMLLAWTTEHGKFWNDAANDDWLFATQALAEAFVRGGGEAIVGAGSCAEYEWNGSRCREDATPLVPATPYGRAKAALYASLTRLCLDRNARCAWGRVFFAYGPGEPAPKLIPSLIDAALDGRPLVLREPHRRLDFVHANDVASAFVALGSANANGAYNLATGRDVSIWDVAAEIAAQTRTDVGPERHETAPPAPDVTADVARLQALGWSAAFDLRSGMADAIAARRTSR
ncbi:MAG TPA: NAD(P)-dependent oxidoreductase [Candidatus Baltobacteraceae bacterium]